MDFIEVWNFIVNEHEKHKNELEEKVQEQWEQYLAELFGYRKLFGEIAPQMSLQAGVGKIRPDIVIKKGECNLFALELKQYNKPFKDEFEEQLISYMNQLHLSIGVLICEKIYVYSYHYIDNDIKKVEIPFEENNYDGVKFIELFQKGIFSIGKAKEFVDSKNNVIKEIEKIKKEITKDNILTLLEEYFQSDYSSEAIETALEELSISIGWKNTGNPDPDPDPKPRQKYTFEGKHYNKTRLVLAVINSYVNTNPCTYTELKTIFYDRIQGSWGVIKTEREIRERTQDPRKRFHMDSPLKLIDGTTVYVCSQWGSGLNFEDFLRRVKALGYQIEETN